MSVVTVMVAESTTLLVFKYGSFYLLMAPKGERSDAGHLDMSKRRPKVFALLTGRSHCTGWSIRFSLGENLQGSSQCVSHNILLKPCCSVYFPILSFF